MIHSNYFEWTQLKAQLHYHLCIYKTSNNQFLYCILLYSGVLAFIAVFYKHLLHWIESIKFSMVENKQSLPNSEVGGAIKKL